MESLLKISYEETINDYEWIDDSLEPVNEAFLTDVTPVEGDVYTANFPFMDGTSRRRSRPVVFLKCADGKLRCFRFSEDRPGSEAAKDPNNYKLKDMEGTGITHGQSLFVISIFRDHEVMKGKYKERIGHLSNRDIEGCYKGIKTFEKEKYKNPVYLLNWYKGYNIEESKNSSGNNNDNILANFDMIERTMRANCVDIAFTVHEVCKRAGLEHYIFKTSFNTKDGRRGSGHVYCIYKNDEGKWCAFRYFPCNGNKQMAGDINRYETIESAIQYEVKYLREYHIHLLGTKNLDIVTTKFTDKQLEKWESFIGKRTQKFMMRYMGVEWLYDTLKQYSYGKLVKNKVSKGYDISFDDYRTIDPKAFHKYKVGVCWDYVEAEAIEFDKLGFNFVDSHSPKEGEYAMYYMVHITTDGICPTHTWLAYMIDHTLYSFEISWGSHMGLNKFNNEKDMIDTYLEWQDNVQKEENRTVIDRAVFRYSQSPKFGLTPDQYMQRIYNTGVPVIDSRANTNKHDMNLAVNRHFITDDNLR